MFELYMGFFKDVITGGATVLDVLTTTTIGGLSLLSILTLGGLLTFLGIAIVRWFI